MRSRQQILPVLDRSEQEAQRRQGGAVRPLQ
jgi:hypothetical protein